MIVPHGSYLMNCGSPNDETMRKSRAMLVDELQRCEKLGLSLFNFHPGRYFANFLVTIEHVSISSVCRLDKGFLDFFLGIFIP